MAPSGSPDNSVPAVIRAPSCLFFLDVAFWRAAMIGFRTWFEREPPNGGLGTCEH